MAVTSTAPSEGGRLEEEQPLPIRDEHEVNEEARASMQQQQKTMAAANHASFTSFTSSSDGGSFGAAPTMPVEVRASAAPPVPPRPPLRVLGRTDSQFAREKQWEEYQYALQAAAKDAAASAALTASALQQATSAAAASSSSASGGLWHRLARGIETEAELHQFFARRQAKATPDGKRLHIASCVKLVNNEKLYAFASAGSFHTSAQKAYHHGDTFLFHGCPQASATNIQADGLCMSFASNGMLGKGLYGAPDPRKSERYCKNSTDGKFMFVCRFNLSAAKYAGPNTQHRNSVYEEFCVYDDRHVVVLWMVKLV